jgi:hypothetical protein
LLSEPLLSIDSTLADERARRALEEGRRLLVACWLATAEYMAHVVDGPRANGDTDDGRPVRARQRRLQRSLRRAAVLLAGFGES